jgi:hypothetical protein
LITWAPILDTHLRFLATQLSDLFEQLQQAYGLGWPAADVEGLPR